MLNSSKSINALFSKFSEQVEYLPWKNVQFMQDLILEMQYYLNLPFSVIVILTAIILRTLVLPVSIIAIKDRARMTSLFPELKKISTNIQEAQASGDKEKLSKSQQVGKDFMERHGRLWIVKWVFPAIFVQMPLFFTAIRAISGIAQNPFDYPDFALESPLWLTSLALSDPYHILPLIVVSMYLTHFSLSMATAPQGTPAGMMNFIAILSIPLLWNVPSGILLYMVGTSSFSILQARIISSKKVVNLLDVHSLSGKSKSLSEIDIKKLKELSRTLSRVK